MARHSIEEYGAPTYGPGGPFEGWALHTPENPDVSLASAIAIARWQASAGNTSGGSYHGILGHSGSDAPATCTDEDHWTMVKTVPWSLAAGGLSTRRDAVWSPGRFPRIEANLSAAAYADPNRFLHQISLSGKAAWYEANGYPKGCVRALVRWIRQLETTFEYDAFLTMHRQWQTNRSDPGPLSLTTTLLAEYERQTTVPDPQTPPPDPQTRFDDVPKDHPQYRAIEWAAESGIATGSGDPDLFKPDGPIDRAQLAAWLYRYDRTKATTAAQRTFGANERVGPDDPESVMPDDDELRALEPSEDEVRELMRK